MARKLPGADVLVCHCPPEGFNDDPADPAHVGFEGLRDWVDRHNPRHVLHGHVHPMPGRVIDHVGGHPGALGAGGEADSAGLRVRLWQAPVASAAGSDAVTAWLVLGKAVSADMVNVGRITGSDGHPYVDHLCHGKRRDRTVGGRSARRRPCNPSPPVQAHAVTASRAPADALGACHSPTPRPPHARSSPNPLQAKFIRIRGDLLRTQLGMLEPIIGERLGRADERVRDRLGHGRGARRRRPRPRPPGAAGRPTRAAMSRRTAAPSAANGPAPSVTSLSSTVHESGSCSTNVKNASSPCHSRWSGGPSLVGDRAQPLAAGARAARSMTAR